MNMKNKKMYENETEQDNYHTDDSDTGRTMARKSKLKKSKAESRSKRGISNNDIDLYCNKMKQIKRVKGRIKRKIKRIKEEKRQI